METIGGGRSGAFSRGIFVAVRDPALIRKAMGDRSYAAVQRECGVPTSTLNDLARGACARLSAPYAAALEAALGVAPGELFGLRAADAQLLAAYSREPVPATPLAS